MQIETLGVRRRPFPRGWTPLVAALLAILAGSAASSRAAGPFADDAEVPKVLVTLESRIEPAVARPGEHARLIVTASIADGWYIYSLEPQGEFAPPPTLLTVTADGLNLLGIPYEVNAKVKHDQVFDMTLAYHTHAARFYQNLQVPEGHGPGEARLNGTLRFQVCNNRLCTPPQRQPIAAALTIEEGPVRPAFAFMQRTIDYLDSHGTFRLNADTLEEAMSRGLGAFLLLAVAFGLLSLLTPCVFPMIPITVSFFTAAAKERQGSTFRLALLFAAGIIVTYTGLGLVLTFLLGAAGASRFATNPWVNLAVAGFFVLFALSLMGLFDLALPPALVNWLDRRGRGIKGPLGVMVMGLAFTATSFTCTVQFVGTLLIAAVAGQIFWPLLGMIVFSAVFALPFFLLALFPQYVMAFRGRSGPWLTQLKVVLGILELLAALKFVSNADLAWQWGFFDRTLLLAVAAALGALCAVVVLGLLPWPGLRVRRPSLPRLAWGAAFVALGVYFLAGVRGRELDAYTEAYLPPPLEHRAARGGGERLEVAELKKLPWLPTLEAALAEARSSGKPIFIDFTGYTCINCRWMEKEVFAEKSVYQTFRDRFVLAQLYTDGGERAEENQKLQVERFRTLALPYYVILSPDNAVLAKHAGIMPNPADFLAWLDQGARQMASTRAAQ